MVPFCFLPYIHQESPNQCLNRKPSGSNLPPQFNLLPISPIQYINPLLLSQYCPWIFPQNTFIGSNEHSNPSKIEVQLHPVKEQAVEEQKLESEDAVFKKQYVQRHKSAHNVKKNVLTSIARQILSFLCSDLKLKLFLLKFSQNISQSILSQLRQYVNGVRLRNKGYISLSKIKEIWAQNTSNTLPKDIYSYFRQISYSYLVTDLRLKTIKSSRLKKLSKSYYLKGIRQFSEVIRANK